MGCVPPGPSVTVPYRLVVARGGRHFGGRQRGGHQLVGAGCRVTGSGSGVSERWRPSACQPSTDPLLVELCEEGPHLALDELRGPPARCDPVNC